MPTDRNLLFGILALQMDFVTRDQLIAGMQAWMGAKHRSLGDILHEQGALRDDGLQLLDALVAKHVEMHHGDPRKSLAAVSSIHSVREELDRLADADLQASLVHVARDRPDAGADSTIDQSVGVSSTGLRFRILRHHARGGLGEVHVARDEELQREVALKEIQERHADHPESRARFLVEAEITGRLEHPGIVPVYGLGQYADGRPFYAMRFIRGDSLKKAIENYHRVNPAGQASNLPRLHDADRNVHFRNLLRRFLDVCNAIQYAHDRGVLHRDLKPGNIMLGKYGETLVVDWGLAKAGITTPPSGQARKTNSGMNEEPPLDPAQLSGSGETVAGTTLGTPQYMSPEQAAGRLDLLGPASDVYSLGATLHTLLTGKPPVEGKDKSDVMDKVRRGEIIRPRQAKPDVPPALEAVCLQAMALEPSDRYPHPRDLAEDIEHWLADEPVSAWPEPWTVRTRRWVDRHRTAVTSAAAVLVVATVALIGGNRLLSQANEKLTSVNQQLGEAKVKTEKALANLQVANDLTRLVNEKLRLSEKQARDFASLADIARKQAESERSQKEAQLERTERMLYLTAFREAVEKWKIDDHFGAYESLDNCRWNLRGPEFGYFSNFCRRSCRFIGHHETEITCLEITRDGAKLYSGSGKYAPGELKVWDTASGKELRSLRKTNVSITSLAITPEGTQLATGSTNGTITLWDAVRLEPQASLKGHKETVADLAFSPDGKLLFSAGWDTTIKVWDPIAKKEIRTLDGHSEWVTNLARSPDGSRLISGSWDDTVRVWDSNSGKPMLTVKGQTLGVPSLDLRHLYTGNHEGKIKAWDLATGKERKELGSHEEEVLSLAISPDGKRLASGTDNHPTGSEIKVWNLEKETLERTLRGHPGMISRLVFSPDGNKVYSASNDGSIREWGLDVEMATAEWRDPGKGVRNLTLSPDGKQAYVVGVDGVLRVWDAENNKLLRAFPKQDAAVTTVETSNGTSLFLGDDQGRIQVLDPQTGKLLRTLQGPSKTIRQLSCSPDGKRLVALGPGDFVHVWDLPSFEFFSIKRPFPIRCVAFSPNGRSLALGHPKIQSEPSRISLIDIDSKMEIGTFASKQDDVRDLKYSPDGRFLIAAGFDSRTRRHPVVIVDIETKEQRTYHGEPKHGVDTMALSGDGKRLFTAGYDSSIGIWDLETGRQLLTLAGHGKAITSLALSPDGRTLFSGSLDGTVKVWTWDLDQRIFHDRTHTGRPFLLDPGAQRAISTGIDNRIHIWDLDSNQDVLTLRGHTGTVRCLTMDGKGNRLFSGGRDHTIIEWNLDTGKEVRRFSTPFRGHKGSVECLSLSRDDRFLFSGSMDGTIGIWDLLSGKAVRTLTAENRGVACLTISWMDHRIFAGGMDGSIQVLDPETGTIAILEGHLDPVTSLALSPDGSHLYSASDDHTIKVWNTQTLKEIHTLVGHQDAVRCLELSRDGTRLYSAGDDFAAPAEIIEWESATYRKVRTLPGHDGPIESLRLWPDGNWLFSACKDGTIRVRDLRHP